MRGATFIAVLAMLCVVGCSIERAGGLIVDTGVRSGRSDAGHLALDSGGLSRDSGGAMPEPDAGRPEPDAGCRARGGVCEPGATSSTTEACGNCGTRTVDLTCNALCLWEARPKSCMGEGECAPGSSGSYDDPMCTDCVRRVETRCDASCRWIATSSPSCSDSATCDAGDFNFCVGSRGAGLECCPNGEIRLIGTCGL